MYTVVIAGGGAAGFFAALNISDEFPCRIIVLEKSSKLLSKVKISGGGRCNVTHACFEPSDLIPFYPRGGKELLGPFHVFQPGDVFDWFGKRGVELKVEEDNRVFPVSDNSQTIIDCFLREAENKKVEIRLNEGLESFSREEDPGGWNIRTTKENMLKADALLITAGSSPLIHNMLKSKGLSMIDQVPSLFTFNISDRKIKDLPGISSPHAAISIPEFPVEGEGPLLITHWGLSGPAVLKLSAVAARVLHRLDYRFRIIVNWDARFTEKDALSYLKDIRINHAKKFVSGYCPFDFPIRLWQSLSEDVVPPTLKWADAGNPVLEKLAKTVAACEFTVNGKSTFKDEFVTAGGVNLKEINFKTMEARRFKNLYFAGEVLDIDAVTGGFNFQAAWTTAFVAARALSENIASQKSF